MTSSSCYNLWISGLGEPISHDPSSDRPTLASTREVKASRAFKIDVQRPTVVVAAGSSASSAAAALPRLRLRLGGEVIREASPQVRGFQTDREPWLRNEVGESELVLERETAAGSGEYVTLILVPLEIQPLREVWQDLKAMLESVAAIHEGLAQDVIGRGFLRGSLAGSAATQLQPGQIVRKLRGLHDELRRCLDVIARQPSVRLDWTNRRVRYRGGDRLGPAALAYAVRERETRVDSQGRIVSLGAVQVRNPVLSDDLEEHRQIADGLRRLARHAAGLARSLEQSAAQLHTEQERWGKRKGPGKSVYERLHLPRAEMLHGLSQKASALGSDFLALLYSYPFLENVGPPRTTLGPTPTFLGRPAYREVYSALLQARESLKVLVDDAGVRIQYRGLARLYEYWCFLQTISCLREWFGPPRAQGAFSLDETIYTPELTPGQRFEFQAAGGLVIATYEPEFPPHHARPSSSAAAGPGWVSSLTDDPLRPDILVEVRIPGQSGPTALVLDAKSTDYFSPSKFREMADYTRQVFDPTTGRQPIRQVFLLHRDRDRPVIENLPGYLKGFRTVPKDSTVLGAVPCIPRSPSTAPNELAGILRRFLTTHGLTVPFTSSRPAQPHPDLS